MQRDGFFGDARRVAHQIERFHQFVAGELMLAAEAVGIGALLNFVSGKRGGHDSRAGLHLDLMDCASRCDEAKNCSMRRNSMDVSASVTPLTRDISRSAASSRSSWRSSGIGNGSLT